MKPTTYKITGSADKKPFRRRSLARIREALESLESLALKIEPLRRTGA